MGGDTPDVPPISIEIKGSRASWKAEEISKAALDRLGIRSGHKSFEIALGQKRMRIKIEHVEIRTGLLLKETLHEVRVFADFTHEEKQIIRQRSLMDHALMERWPCDARPDDDPDWYALRVRHLVERRPDRFRCRTPSDAKIYEVQLTEVLQGMKAWLDQNAETGGTTVLEL